MELFPILAQALLAIDQEQIVCQHFSGPPFEYTTQCLRVDYVFKDEWQDNHI